MMRADGTGDDGEPGMPDPSSPRAWRVTFTSDGDRVRVIGRQRVATIAPPDDTALVEGADAGYWVELRDADGETLYCQVIHAPLGDQLEVFSADKDEPLHRLEAAEPSGVFQVLVPDDPAAHEIVLHGRQSSADAHQRSARQLVKARLVEQPLPEAAP